MHTHIYSHVGACTHICKIYSSLATITRGPHDITSSWIGNPYMVRGVDIHAYDMHTYNMYVNTYTHAPTHTPTYVCINMYTCI